MKSMKSVDKFEGQSATCQIGKSSGDVVAYKECSPKRKASSAADGGNTPPVVMLHGLMRGKETWDGCSQVIADRTHSKVYSLDARNHGDSKWVDTMDYDSMADDVIQFMDNMKIPKAIIVGYGMGAKTGMVLALKHPHRTHSLILEDTCLSSHSKSREHLKRLVKTFNEALEYISDIEPKTLKEAKRSAVSAMVVRHYYLTIKRRKNKPKIWDGNDLPLKKAAAKGGFEWKLNLKSIEESMPCDEPWTHTGLFEGPVLVIYGTHSISNVLEDRVRFLQLFPRALYEPIEDGVDYSLHIEYPDHFRELVCDFLLKNRG